ncbi:MAG: hypothetical protein M1837_000866 [Sclerophora amabilis]|nr:MAG: hypothetical protein M1837_000866 [Sclerophora amabilis]
MGMRVVSNLRLFHPSRIRPSLVFYNQSPQRQRFSSTPNRPFIEPALLATHSLLDTLHSSSGLPWAATLPFAALVIRTSIVLPLAISNRRSLQRQLDLKPLLSAWQHQIRIKVLRESGSLGPKACERLAKKATIVKQRDLYKRWNCARWKGFLALGQVPVFLIVIETIRRMCGTHEGLLGLVTRQFGGQEVDVDVDRQAVLEKISPDTGSTVSMDPTLAQEGMLWFPNLLVPDPMLILPFALSASLFISVSRNTRRAKSVQDDKNVFYRRLTNGMKIFALMIGPATLQVPSAMLVYWISSTVFGIAQSVILDRLMPLRHDATIGRESPHDKSSK